MSAHDIIMGAAGNSGSAPVYVDDVFQTVAYAGTGGDQKISTSIPLADEDLTSGIVLQMDCETLTDQCRVPTTLTLNGTSSLSTNYSKFGSKSLYTAPATSGAQVQPNHVSAPVSSRWTFGTNNFTIEFHIYLTGATASDSAIICSELPTRNWLVQIRSGNVLSWQSSPGPSTGFGTLPSYNEWHHVAYVRNGNELAVYVNGTKLPTTANFTGINLNKIAALQIGSHKTNDLYLDNIRITNGTALYTSDFTPPSAPYPADTGPVPTLKKKKDALMWFATRTNLNYGQHVFLDTVRGVQNSLYSTNTNASYPYSDVTALYADGYKLSWLQGDENYETSTYVNWIFAKQKKFFDIITYTGNGSTQDISHNLGSVPGCIFVKNISSAQDWFVYHRSVGNSSALLLNSSTSPVGTDSWGYMTPTSTQFRTGSEINNSGNTYVAYVFAHNAGGFGSAGTDNVISCGNFTTDGSGNASIELGYEPQFVIHKKIDSSQNWVVTDVLRGWGTQSSQRIYPNVATTEGNTSNYGNPNATGFNVRSLTANSQYIYMAVRRPHKPPTTGTEVFHVEAYSGNSTNGRTFTTGFPVDMNLTSGTDSSGNSRCIGTRMVDGMFQTETTAVTYNTLTDWLDYDSHVQIKYPSAYQFSNQSGMNYITCNFKRAPSFMDIVCYTGTGANRTISHSLGVAPEMMIIKERSSADEWQVYHSYLGNDEYVLLNRWDARDTRATAWNNTSPTSSVFSVGTSADINQSGQTYTAHLFATCPGVSKVGYYTGTGTTNPINCGFSNGARLVIIKRVDAGGDWYMWNSARGIVAGNDPYLKLDSSAAETTNTDYIDPYSAGFELSSTASTELNENGGQYIYLAIA